MRGDDLAGGRGPAPRGEDSVPGHGQEGGISGLPPGRAAAAEPSLSTAAPAELAAYGLSLHLPKGLRLYLDHIGGGLSLRALARREGCHASKVMRQVRRYENRRDDPLLDAALEALGRAPAPQEMPPDQSTPDQTVPSKTSLKGKDGTPMSAPLISAARHHDMTEEMLIAREARRVLRRLAEPGAVLAVAPDMEKSAVLRTMPDGRALRTAVVDRAVAQGFVLRDWIACRKPGRVASYELTATGRAALKRMVAEDAAGDPQSSGLAEEAAPFAAQHRDWAEREVAEPGGAAGGTRRLRYNLAESPVAVLGRRRDKDGKPFLEPELVRAAERLREDFELAQMGPRVTQNWDRFLTGADRGGFRPDSGLAEGPGRARERVAAALRDLGPGLGDVALRVCCFLEGIETAERRMGWAARSGKIVLRIALMRLRRHYDETYGRSGPLIG